MKQSDMKGFSLFKPRTRYRCNRCKCGYKVFGDTWIYTAKATRAVDGKPAFRIYWICRCGGHKIMRGYTRYVSHVQNSRLRIDNTDFRDFADEEEEIEVEWKEMIETATKLKNLTRNRLFY